MLSSPKSGILGIEMILRDYFYRLDELLRAFDEISRRMRYTTSDEDYSAEARKRKKRTEKAITKYVKVEETSATEE